MAVHELMPNVSDAVAEWMGAQGWPVGERFYAPDKELLGWRYRGPNGEKFTLRIEEDVLAFGLPSDLQEMLSGLRVAEAMRANPRAYVVVRHFGHSVGVRTYADEFGYLRNEPIGAG